MATKAPAVPDADRVNFHGQFTFLEQAYPAFRSPYQGPNSLPGGGQGRETSDGSLFAGVRLWKGAEVWINPEIDQGFGLANTLGVAGFTSGEAYKIGQAYPYARLPRAFIRQTIDLGGATEKVEAGTAQFAGSQTANRLVLTIGKLSVVDIFDTNKYAHDPRTDFLNWAIVDTGTFDYAADAWGYTYGAAAEWYQGDWAVRAGVFDLSIVPNSADLDPTFKQFQSVGEIERRYTLWNHPGEIHVTGFLTRGRMGTFADAIALAAITGGPADIAAVRHYQSRAGVSMNIEQEITSDLGAFMRAGWADGTKEPYEFTDIDRTVAGGVSIARQTMGPTGRHDRYSRRPQPYCSCASSFFQCWWLGHSGRRRTITPSRLRRNHRGLLQLCVDRLDPGLTGLSVRRQSWIQYRSRACECFCWPIALAVLSTGRGAVQQAT